MSDVPEIYEPRSNCKNIDEETKKAIDEIDAKFLSISIFKQKNSALTSDPGEEYLFNHKRRGKCVIFNHRFFEEKMLNERKGTEIDAHALKACFAAFDFEVKAYDDLTVAELFAMLRALSKEDHSDADCFACCIMTHGDEANLWARNSKYPVDLLFQPFTADNCPSLAGKPKMFFIQACRGDKLDPGVMLKIGIDETDSARYYTIPTWADFLISYSTVPGYYSWRNTRDGSWFMQSLAEIMMTHGSELSFLDIMTKVNRKVAYDYTSQAASDKKFDKQKQAPSTVHMLTRRLLLRPKPKQNDSQTSGAKNTGKVTTNVVNNVTTTSIKVTPTSVSSISSTTNSSTTLITQIQPETAANGASKDAKEQPTPKPVDSS